MQVSKWLSIPALLGAEELEALLNELAPVQLFVTGQVLESAFFPIDQFLAQYRRYLANFSKELPTMLWTTTAEAIEIRHVEGKGELARPILPIVQVQPHTFSYSPLDGKYRSQVRGEGAISWGLQFSYPQIYENPTTRAIEKIDESFPNTALFRKLQRWVRRNTLPTPFVAEGNRTNVPIRLGKGCFEWINNHPQLAAAGIEVAPCKSK